jgi:MFS family permease
MKEPVKLLNKNFFLLWQGQSVSMLGSHVLSIAVILWIKHITGSASLLGLLGMLAGIPAALFSTVGGTVADRYSRRKIIIYSDILKGIAILALGGFLYFTPLSTQTIIICIFVVTIFTATISAFFTPAISASIPDIVPKDKITQANSLGQLSTQLSMFFGQGLGGVLFRILGAPLLIIFNGLTFLFSAVSEAFIDIPQTIPEKKGKWREQLQSFKDDFMEGFGYVWKAKGLKKLVFASIFLTFFTTPIILLLPFYVEDYLKLDTFWYGFILSAHGFGSLVGFILAGFLTLKPKSRAIAIAICMILGSLIYGLLVIATGSFSAMLISAIAGIFSGFITVNVLTILQITTPSNIRGRVFGFLITANSSMVPIGMGLSGLIADVLGQNIPLIYIICSGIMVFISLLVAISTDIREFLSFDKEKESVKLEPEEVLYQQALKYKKAGDYIEVIQLLNKALIYNRRDIFVLYELALMNFELGNFDNAIWYLKLIFESSPNNIKGLFLAAAINKRTNDFDRARIYLNKVLDVDPNHKTALINLGVIYNLQGDYNNSIQIFDRITRIYPTDLKGYLGMAKNYNSLEDHRRVAVYLDKAENIGSNLPKQKELLKLNLYIEIIEDER